MGREARQQAPGGLEAATWSEAGLRAPSAPWVWGVWLFGLALLGAVALVATRVTEERELARLGEAVRPLVLAGAGLLQVGTYALEAAVWGRIVARGGVRLPARTLVGLAFGKLFLDQALPSAGLSGLVLMVQGLGRRGVSRATSMGAVLLEMRAYYLAYTLALAAALVLLWTGRHLTRFALVPAAGFFLFAAGLSTLLASWSRGRRVPRLERLRLARPLLVAVREASPAITRDPDLLLHCTLYSVGIFLLDAATVWVLLVGVGVTAPPGAVFASFMLSSLARTIGVVPGGIGTFEAVSVATLGLSGVPVGAALAATLLFRGFSFWLPLLPGVVFARRESRGRPLVAHP